MKMYGSPSGVAADRYKTAARFAEEGSYTVVAADKAGNKSAAYMFVIADMLRLGLLPVLVELPQSIQQNGRSQRGCEHRRKRRT